MENSQLIEVLTEIKSLLNSEDFYLGICNVIEYLYNEKKLTEDEMLFVDKFVMLNRPNEVNEYKEFTTNKFWFDRGFWWIPIFKAPATRQIRIDYLTKLISTIK